MTHLARASAVLVATLLAAGCTGSGSAPPKGTVIHVSERDFQIALTPAVVPAGQVTLIDRNVGPETHELIIVRAGNGPLPLRPDGITVDETALAPRTVGQVPGAGPGSVRTLHLDLKPGRYDVFCNMLGHYMGGMSAQIVVR